jgi:tripartite-type tricarboxylate transporter receptor subunit TctC
MTSTHLNRRRATGVALAALGALASVSALPAAAQSGFPNKPVHLIVPFPPGGTADISGRVLADALTKELGQTVVVENKAGAGGSVGARFVAEAKPDGYTLLLGTTSTNGTNSAVFKNLQFDAVKSFTPITRIFTVPGALSVGKRMETKTYAELAKAVNANPNKYSYASSGNGGATHLSMEFFKSLSGFKVSHIPYRGTGPALNDVIGGQVEMIYDTLASSMPHIKSGNLVPIALATPQRVKELPNVPTFAELGFPTANDGVLAPADLPADVLQKLHSSIQRAVRTTAVQEKFASVGAISVEDTPAAFAKIIAEDVAKWKKVAEANRIVAD